MESKNNSTKRKSFLTDIPFISLGWELAFPIFAGTFLGYQIDHHIVGKNYTFTLILLFLGIGAGYYSLYRAIELEMLRAKIAKQRSKPGNGEP